MKQVFRILVILSLALAVLAILSGVGLWHDHPGFSVSINGDDLDWQGLGDMNWLGAVAGLGIAAVALCIVVPLVLLFSIGLPLLLIGLVVTAVVVSVMSVGALLFSPLIVIGVLLYLLPRTKKPRASRASIAP